MADLQKRLRSAAPQPRQQVDPAVVRARGRTLRFRRRATALGVISLLLAATATAVVGVSTPADVALVEEPPASPVQVEATETDASRPEALADLSGGLRCTGASADLDSGRSAATPEQALASHGGSAAQQDHTPIVFDGRVQFWNAKERTSVTVEGSGGRWRLAAKSAGCTPAEQAQVRRLSRAAVRCADGRRVLRLYNTGYSYGSQLSAVHAHVTGTLELPRGGYFEVGRSRNATLFGYVTERRTTGIVAVSSHNSGFGVLSASWCEDK